MFPPHPQPNTRQRISEHIQRDATFEKLSAVCILKNEESKKPYAGAVRDSAQQTSLGNELRNVFCRIKKKGLKEKQLGALNAQAACNNRVIRLYAEKKKDNRLLKTSPSMLSKEGIPERVFFGEDFMPHSSVKRKRR
jgi:hypothetical protein